MKLRVYGIKQNSSVDGPGLRYAIFVQGCPRACPGCHNPESQEMGDEFGELVEVQRIVDEIVKDPLLTGVSFSGGEPFLYPNECSRIIDMVKEERADMSFWAWSGYRYDELIEDNGKLAFLEKLNILVDGPFIEDKKDLSILWRGSSNQRIIDVPRSLAEETIIVLPDSTWYVPDKTPKIKLHN